MQQRPGGPSPARGACDSATDERCGANQQQPRVPGKKRAIIPIGAQPHALSQWRYNYGYSTPPPQQVLHDKHHCNARDLASL